MVFRGLRKVPKARIPAAACRLLERDDPMKHQVLGAVLALSVAAPALAETPAFGPLLSPAEFAAFAEGADPLILDIRTGNAADGRPIFEAGHVPGAIHAPYGLFRGPAENPGQVPDDARLTEVLRGLGVEFDRPTLIVHQGTNESDFGAAARVYWTLKSSGVSQIAILNGGFGAWVEDGFEASTEARAAQPSDITVTFSAQWLATTQDVLDVVEGRETALLLDSRPQSFFEGREAHAAAARPGTLPQSRYFTHSGWFASGPSRIDADAVREIARREGYVIDDTLVSFCNTGHWAATNWFALSEIAGVQDVRLYPDSMVGWSQAGLPMDNVPGALRNLLSQFR